MKYTFKVGTSKTDTNKYIAECLDCYAETVGDTEQDVLKNMENKLKLEMQYALDLWESGFYDDFETVIAYNFIASSKEEYDWFKDNGKIHELNLEIPGDIRPLADIEKDRGMI